MNLQNKIIRELLRRMNKQEAKAILNTYIADEEEWKAIYYCDVENKTIGYVADSVMQCSQSTVKRYKRSGYQKLAVLISS